MEVGECVGDEVNAGNDNGKAEAEAGGGIDEDDDEEAGAVDCDCDCEDCNDGSGDRVGGMIPLISSSIKGSKNGAVDGLNGNDSIRGLDL